MRTHTQRALPEVMFGTFMKIPIPTEIPDTAVGQDIAQGHTRQVWASFAPASWTGLQMLSGWPEHRELGSPELSRCSWPADQHEDHVWLVHRIQPTLLVLHSTHRNDEVNLAWNQGNYPISF